MNRMLFLANIALMRFNFLIAKLCHRKVKFVGDCCCHRLKIDEVGDTSGNCIEFGKHVVLRNCRVRFEGNSHTLRFGDGIRLDGVSFYFEKNSSDIVIGEGTWIGPECELSAFDNSSIKIGSGCIFAKQCVIRTSDSHVIMDLSGTVLNRPTNISIGSRVWLGQQTFVLKGSVIPDSSIIGARSMVTASFKADENSISVGQPAKMIKRDIQWEL